MGVTFIQVAGRVMIAEGARPKRRFSMERSMDKLWYEARSSGITRTQFVTDALEMLVILMLRDRIAGAVKPIQAR
jgi:hypothetical protein